MKWIDNVLNRLRQKPRTQESGELPDDPVGDQGGKIRADSPITNENEDTLGRSSIAKTFGREILEFDWSDGIVVGVLGAWGSGKTSFINLARKEIESSSIAVIDFNPWMFSGAEQLLQSFFSEIAAQLRLRSTLSEVAESIEAYGETFSAFSWLPVLGPWIARGGAAAKAFNTITQRRKRGMGAMRARVEKTLTSLERPVVVVLDDIDRLSTQEVRDVFKLIRLIAKFPNVIYLVAFDRSRVEDALSHDGIPGRDYLEKILQIAVDLPSVPAAILRSQVLTAIEIALSDFENPGPFDSSAWPDVFEEVIWPLIRNMRDVRRYAAATRITVRRLKGQVSLVDVLALEAIRTFLPTVYLQITNSVEALTTALESSFSRRGEPPQLKLSIDRLIEVSGDKQEVVRSMISRLFPAAERHIGGSHFGAEWNSHWLRDRRVTHQDILRLYLEGVAGSGLAAFVDAERAFALMHDKDAFDSFLRSLSLNRLESVITCFEMFEDKIPPETVVPGVIVLLNLMPEVPSTTQSLWIPRPGFFVGRIAYRLLRTLTDAARIEAAVNEILPEVKTLSSKLTLITHVGYRENAGHRLVSETTALEFERKWRAEVRAASTEQLAVEADLLRVLSVTKQETTADEAALVLPKTPGVTLALLRSAETEVKSFAFGSRAIHKSPRLHWSTLVDLLDGEDELKRRITELKNAKPEGQDELLALVDKYIEGWRPEKDED